MPIKYCYFFVLCVFLQSLHKVLSPSFHEHLKATEFRVLSHPDQLLSLLNCNSNVNVSAAAIEQALCSIGRAISAAPEARALQTSEGIAAHPHSYVTESFTRPEHKSSAVSSYFRSGVSKRVCSLERHVKTPFLQNAIQVYSVYA